jgi:hypothetical protein
MQFGQGASAKLQRKCLSTTALEDEDENENEAHCEGGSLLFAFPGFPPRAEFFWPLRGLRP